MSNVILIGFMGCGKSTVGRRLSYTLKQPYLDTDRVIECEQQKTINEIFANEGEELFREMETDCIRRMYQNKQDYVIAVGGGLPMRSCNREILADLGKVIYLKAKPRTIYDRLKDDTSRPLLRCENPLQRIEELMSQRDCYYRDAASIVINVDGKTFDEILLEIKEALEE